MTKARPMPRFAPVTSATDPAALLERGMATSDGYWGSAALGGSPPTWIWEPCSSRPQTEQCRTGRNSPPQPAWVSSVAGPSGARNHLSPQSSMTMTCGKKARPLSVSRYSTRPEVALVSLVSRTPIRQKVRSRSDTMAGGAPIMVSMSVNRRAPRNAAARAEADQRLPISSMVCDTSPGPGEPPVERRRVVACGTDRAKPPLGPKLPRTSWRPASCPQSRQCMTGENSSPQALWYMAGSGSMCSVTQMASHDQMVSSTCHLAAAALCPSSLAGWAVRGWRGHVQRRVAVEEAGRLEGESAARDRHDRPVLRARDVRGAERVPDHDVFAVDVPVARDEGGQAGSAGVLVHEVAGRPALVRVVPGDPEMVGGEAGPRGQRGGGVGQQDRRGLRVERVTGRTAEAVGAFGVDDPPDPAAGAVRPPAGLRLAGQPGDLLDDRVAVGVVRPDRQAADIDLFYGVGQPVHGHVQPRAKQVLVERGGEPRRDFGGVGMVAAGIRRGE